MCVLHDGFRGQILPYKLLLLSRENVGVIELEKREIAGQNGQMFFFSSRRNRNPKSDCLTRTLSAQERKKQQYFLQWFTSLNNYKFKPEVEVRTDAMPNKQWQ